MQQLTMVPDDAVVVGYDFSTGGVKALAFDLDGQTLAEVRLTTDLWTEGGVSELNLNQIEGQAHAATRGLASKLQEIGRLWDWAVAGISATHHSSGRLDHNHLQVRRAICWNDSSLAPYHAEGLARLGGQVRARELSGGPWAARYSLSHWLKDEATLSNADWKRTWRILSHGSLCGGYLTGNFDQTSLSSAASTGILDLRTGSYAMSMLDSLKIPANRALVKGQLPPILDMNTPIGPLEKGICLSCGIEPGSAPLLFPASDDQQAGLAGGGAVEAGQIAIILGNSAVVNASATAPPAGDDLDCMRLNWGPYLWMRCYTNGALFLDRILGPNPDWATLEKTGRLVPSGCQGIGVLPFVFPEPSLGVSAPQVEWAPTEPADPAIRYRASLEAIAYLIAAGVEAHEKNGQRISRISVSGGIAKSDLMLEILATLLNRPLERPRSFEGPALGAAAAALAGFETHRRRQAGNLEPYTVADGVAKMVGFREPALPQPAWRNGLVAGYQAFRQKVGIGL